MNIPTMSIERNTGLIEKIIASPHAFSPWGVTAGGLLFFPASVCTLRGRKNSNTMLVAQDAQADYLVEISKSSSPVFTGGHDPQRALFKSNGYVLSLLPVTPALVYEIAEQAPWIKPMPLGSKKPSFGWGNRTQFSTQAVLAATGAYADYKKFNRVIAQNSIRENQILERYLGFKQVMADAMLAKLKMGYRDITGSDADHLKTLDEIRDGISAGFTGYTIDPSRTLKATAGVMVNGHERTLTELAEESRLPALFRASLSRNNIDAGFTERSLRLLAGRFNWISSGDSRKDGKLIMATAVKFGDCWRFMEDAYKEIQKHVLGADFEVSFDETSQPTEYLAHLLTASELIRRGIRVTRFAVKYVGRFEKTTPWIPPAGAGLAAFAENYRKHQRIAEQFGYLQSIHSGSGKYNIFRYCSRSHLKTSGDISRPLVLTLSQCNFRAFCHLFHEMVDSAIDTKKLYGAVSSHSNDFPRLHACDPQKMGRKAVADKLRNDIIWRTFSHYAYGMFKRAAGTFNELLFFHRDACGRNIAAVVCGHSTPLYTANGFNTARRQVRLKTRAIW